MDTKEAFVSGVYSNQLCSGLNLLSNWGVTSFLVLRNLIISENLRGNLFYVLTIQFLWDGGNHKSKTEFNWNLHFYWPKDTKESGQIYGNLSFFSGLNILSKYIKIYVILIQLMGDGESFHPIKVYICGFCISLIHLTEDTT